jgi:NitT/TauT family transport system substrate-binding protein
MLRERKIGHVLVNTTTDKPWSQYFCCMIASTKEFVRRNPVATKRAVRALLKATDLCASDPERVARILVERTCRNSTATKAGPCKADPIESLVTTGVYS